MNKNKTRYKGIIFDLGGVIFKDLGYQSYVGYASKKLKVNPKRLLTLLPKEVAPLQRGEETSVEFWQRICDKLKIDYPADKVLNSLWLVPYRKHNREIPGMIKLVRELRQSYKIAILSNTIEQHSKLNRKRSTFKNFDKILLSNEWGMRKPEKKFFQAAARQLDLPFSKLIFVDDEPRWIKKAKSYGLIAIQFKNIMRLKKQLHDLDIYEN